MSIIVQKFGGTSVADSNRILAAARKAIRAQQQGHQVVMVVSAMGKNTDMLVGLAHEINEKPPAREMDMLLSTGEQVSVALMAMAIDSLGYKAVSLTGGQIGIRTDSSHTKARIQSISTDRMKNLLNEGNIVIAAGFQGIDEDFNITTLGRGGSDTTAVALAAVLNADLCEIYTDVDGVYTTDPRILPEARLVGQVSYNEMLELASLGAGVMHSRSIEFAKKFNVPIHVRSSMTDVRGSIIWETSGSTEAPVFGAAMTRDEARVSIANLPDDASVTDQIFAAVAEAKVTVDMIVKNLGNEGRVDLSFTVPQSDLEATQQAIDPILASHDARIKNIDKDVSKISVVGDGMATQVGVAQKMFASLAEAEIAIQLITTSEIKISVLVSRERALDALKQVHSSFGLDQVPHVASQEDPSREHDIDAVQVVDRLREVGIEGLVIDEISIDESQAAVTVEQVPSQAKVIAELFDRIARGGVLVDMIVESYGDANHSDIAFTVPVDQLMTANEIASQFAQEKNAGAVRLEDKIAKLSVSGIGLRSHTGVAVKSFRALAAASIPLLMINTSEIRVNIVVPGAFGSDAIEKLRQEFSADMV